MNQTLFDKLHSLNLPETEQTLRITGKIDQLMNQLGVEDFVDWYGTTSMNDDRLERQLDEKLAEVTNG